MSGRVLVLGTESAGAMAARVVSRFEAVSGLIVADLEENEAARIALSCRPGAEAAAVDLADEAAVAALLGRADLVVNCAGPSSRRAPAILRAAIEAGTDYIDICDAPGPTRDMLDLDAAARRAGVSAVVGMGASPGLANLLAACAVSRLDRVDRLVAGRNIEEDGDALACRAAVVRLLGQCSGAIPERRHGEPVEGPALADVPIDYPGRGRRSLYAVGHPGAVSFPLSWPEVREARCGLVMPAAWSVLFRRLRDAVDAGAMTVDEAAGELVGNASGAGWLEALVTALSHLTDGPRLPLLFALAEGERDGKKRAVAASLAAAPPDAACMTGVPPALGALLLLRGQVPGPGVMAPEQAFEPEAFFRLFAPYCTLPGPCPAERLVALAEA
ncbi:saccharopine dehydrogenase NADP-binding domain-containing protein [Solidesulfovibrio sp.]|uniref:saccharopine dehydrogenase family protein n=1 Tax=Solidesulfovibrio sp. TaxID=2910990 RepID=UPI00262369FD|nr:saccharopine dehydrogenase NADP-binding domain-containing protein [Solidesulfovibrio sp.]